MLNNNSNLKETIKAEAYNLGFCVIGFSSPSHFSITTYKNWLEKDYHAGMSYLAKNEAINTRQNPLIMYPECKTIISLGAAFSNPAKENQKVVPINSGKIASYAVGTDYHQILETKIKQLMEIVNQTTGENIQWQSAVDTKPLPEKELAQQAGLGWIAKNSMLTNPNYGSAVFLCEILINLELEPDEPFLKDFCGSCTKCIDACPTKCIQDNRTINANKCISYLTIEHRGIIPEVYFEAINESIFGCDICLQVCPWNQKAKSEPIMEEFRNINQTEVFDISKNLEKVSSAFHRNFENSAIRRAGKEGFLRNCMIRLAQNPTSDNLIMIDRIVSTSQNTYLSEQKKLIDNYIEKKKGS